MSQKYNKSDLFIKKISYQAERLHDSLAFFDFYDPLEQIGIKRELQNYSDIEYQFFGGHNTSERKMLCMGNGEIDENIIWPISVCKAEIQFEVDHRMVLGAIMQLGINREIIGDIIIKNDSIQVIAKNHIAEFISLNVDKLSNRKVYFEVHDIRDLMIGQQNFITKNITISSFRIDAIVSAAYGISRDTATEIIKKRGLKINYEEKTKPSHTAKIGDLFSVRGKGRFILEDFTGTTRKEKNKVTIKKYM